MNIPYYRCLIARLAGGVNQVSEQPVQQLFRSVFRYHGGDAHLK